MSTPSTSLHALNTMTKILTTEFWIHLIQKNSEAALHAIIQIIFVLFLYVIARVVVFRLIDRATKMIVTRQQAVGNGDAIGRARTLGGVMRSISGYMLVFLAGFTILAALGVDQKAALTVTGMLGLAIGFGAQKLVKDVISGFFILLENQYAVGEYVTMCGVSGVVEDVEMRTTKIRDDVGKITIISNGDISQVTNHSRGELLTNVEISVSSESDLDVVRTILRGVGAKVANDHSGVLSPFTCDGLAAMDGTKVTMRLVGRVEPSLQEEVQMEIRKAVREALLEAKVAIA